MELVMTRGANLDPLELWSTPSLGLGMEFAVRKRLRDQANYPFAMRARAKAWARAWVNQRSLSPLLWYVHM